MFLRHAEHVRHHRVARCHRARGREYEERDPHDSTTVGVSVNVCVVVVGEDMTCVAVVAVVGGNGVCVSTLRFAVGSLMTVARTGSDDVDSE